MRPEILRIAPGDMATSVQQWLAKPGRRFGHVTVRAGERSEFLLETLLLDTQTRSCTLMQASLGQGVQEYPSITKLVPAAHWAEREIGDMFGVRAIGHPRWKSLILHDPTWPLDFAPLVDHAGHPRVPYEFLKIEGTGIHEIPVGPIHAGTIEPGHFRISCIGEIIAYLEIRLGYQHRGVEKRLAELPWRKARFLAESAASDTAVGNALAHSVAIESLLDMEIPHRAQHLRTIALELERVANHVGDLGAICGDIGYSACAALFAPLRGAVLGLCELVTGNRYQRYYVRPGGISRDLSVGAQKRLGEGLAEVSKAFGELSPLVVQNSGVLDRTEGKGKISASHCRDFGLVGPAARAAAGVYDARQVFSHALFPERAPSIASHAEGDVLARIRVRIDEAVASLELLAALARDLPDGPTLLSTEHTSLPADSVGIGIVEAWRGELIHWITTRSDGSIARCAIKDPSLNNWTGVAISVRGNLVADFPLCNKSFNLSYSGTDL